KPETLMRVPVGLSSPLWGLFAGAAVGGTAWWWMTRWARVENLEAMFGVAEAALPAPEAPEAPAEAEPAVAAGGGEPLALAERVGAGAAPISPAVAASEPAVELVAEPGAEPVAEAPAEPKPRARKAESKAD